MPGFVFSEYDTPESNSVLASKNSKGSSIFGPTAAQITAGAILPVMTNAAGAAFSASGAALAAWSGAGWSFDSTNNNYTFGGLVAGAAGIGLNNLLNYSIAETAGVSYVNLFRQTSSAATVLANGYKRSATANGFASSVATAWAKSAVVLDNGDVVIYADASTTVANGTDITPTPRVRVKSLGSVRFIPLAAAPASAEAGDVYYDSTLGKHRGYNGTLWSDFY